MCLLQIFQKRNLSLAIVNPAIRGVTTHIQALLDGRWPTPYKDKVDKIREGDKEFQGVKVLNTLVLIASFKGAYKAFLENILLQMGKRFPQESMDVLQSLSVLGLSGIHHMTDEEAATLGVAEIEALTKKYGTGERPYIDGPSTLMEWSILKTTVRTQHYPTDSMTIIWQIVKSHHADTFPNMLLLASIASVFPVHTADVERGFSVQNALKTHRRNRLSSARLNVLATIKLEGAHWREFAYMKALRKFRDVKDRRAFFRH